MAGTTLLALIDDIATILDDVAALTKLTTQKTAGVLGDDLALNAQQVAGVKPERELPVVWAVAKGSAVNKLILVPLALAISAFIPWAVRPLLMVGGAFLCFEGCEKIAHTLFHRESDAAEHRALIAAAADPAVDLLALERGKIKGAIRTDFVLSAEIVAIALGVVEAEPLATQLGVLTLISALMTVGVYGFVAAIVKLDDLGLYLSVGGPIKASLRKHLGRAILAAAPLLMKTLSVAGTVAMFLVGGGILSHGVPALERWIGGLAQAGPIAALLPTLMNLLLGLVVGSVVLAVVTLARRLLRVR